MSGLGVLAGIGRGAAKAEKAVHPVAAAKGAGKRLARRALAGGAVVAAVLVWVDGQTVAAQTPAKCTAGQLVVEVPRPHIAVVSAVRDRPGPHLRDVVARRIPTVALATIVQLNPGVVADPMADIPATPGGVVCLTVPAKTTIAPTAELTTPTSEKPTVPQRSGQAPDRSGSAPASTTRLTDVQLAQVAYRAGFRGQGLRQAVAVALAESRGRTDARCRNIGNRCAPATYRGRILSTDRGLWQINDHAHPEVTASEADTPSLAAREAYRISRRGTDWHEWTTHKHGTDRQYLTRAERAAAAIGA